MKTLQVFTSILLSLVFNTNRNYFYLMAIVKDSVAVIEVLRFIKSKCNNRFYRSINTDIKAIQTNPTSSF